MFTWDSFFLHRDAYIINDSGRLTILKETARSQAILIVRIGKIVCMGCLFSQRDAHIYCENGHPHAYIRVNIGIGMPIFT